MAFLILFSSPNFSYAKGLKSRGQETEISQPHTKMYEFDFSGSEAGPDDTGESVQHALEVNPKLSVLGADRLKIVGQRVQEGILPPTPSNTRQHCIISEEKNTAFSRKLKVIVAWVKKNRLIILVIIIGSLACSLAFFYGVKAFKGYFTRPPEPFPIKGTEINSSNELNAQNNPYQNPSGTKGSNEGILNREIDSTISEIEVTDPIINDSLEKELPNSVINNSMEIESINIDESLRISIESNQLLDDILETKERIEKVEYCINTGKQLKYQDQILNEDYSKFEKIRDAFLEFGEEQASSDEEWLFMAKLLKQEFEKKVENRINWENELKKFENECL